MADLITEPGEYRLDKETYERDPVQGGSLRASVAWLLASKTPAHARYALDNPRKPQRHFDIGSAAHTLLLGRGATIEIIGAEGYKTKSARIARDGAYARGHVPLLAEERETVNAMVAAVRAQLRALVEFGTIPAEPFQHDETERCIVWREANGVMCRASLDGLSLDGDQLGEFKTEAESADPATWQWKARRFGYAFKAVFYMRGLSALGIAHSPSTNFYVVEKEPPHLLSLVRLDDELAMKESERVAKAIRTWGQCQATGRWPGYSLEGYDLTLTERERMAEQQTSGNGHVSSDDIAAGL